MTDTRYSVEEVADESLDTTVYVLRDGEAGSEARVAPARGANLYSFSVPVRGSPLEVLLGPRPEARAGYWFGTPVLFPFPSLLRHGQFSFAGRSYKLDVERNGHAQHGLVSRLPWRVDRAEAAGDGARLTASLTSDEHPNLVRQFPARFRVTLSFTLRDDTVRLDAEARNVGEEPLPLGFGLHPWFRLPLSPSGDRAACLLGVGARRWWELDGELLPTKRVLSPPAERDFNVARPLGDVALDEVYTDVESTDGVSACSIADPAAGAEVVVRADASFREWVVFAPPGRPTICLEPYTCTTDAFNLATQGIDGGLVAVEPGGAWRGSVWITVRSL